MTTSCEAETKAVATASKANTRRAEVGGLAAISRSMAASSNWLSTSQPRRRPSQGSSKRSISGAQRNLKVYGRPTRLRKPMVATSMPSTLSQACIACPVSASGSPEAKPSTVTTAAR